MPPASWHWRDKAKLGEHEPLDPQRIFIGDRPQFAIGGGHHRLALAAGHPAGLVVVANDLARAGSGGGLRQLAVGVAAHRAGFLSAGTLGTARARGSTDHLAGLGIAVI